MHRTMTVKQTEYTVIRLPGHGKRHMLPYACTACGHRGFCVKAAKDETKA